MKKLTALVLAGSLAAGPASAGCTLPTDVSTRVGRAQTFVKDIPDLTALSGTRDFVWGSSGSLPAGVFSGFYITGWRGPAGVFASSYAAAYPLGAYSTYNLAWVQHYHPGWILYRPDTKLRLGFFVKILMLPIATGPIRALATRHLMSRRPPFRRFLKVPT